MGIVGPVCITAGLIGWAVTQVSHNLSEHGSDRSSSASSADSAPWIVLALGGVGMTAAGWILFGTSGTKIRESHGVAVQSTPRIAVGAAPLSGGWITSGGVAF